MEKTRNGKSGSAEKMGNIAGRDRLKKESGSGKKARRRREAGGEREGIPDEAGEFYFLKMRIYCSGAAHG